MSTTSSKAIIVACLVAFGVAGTPAPAHAHRVAVTAPDTGTAKKTDEPVSVEESLEHGDLTTANQTARSARQADPTAGAWLIEAQVLEQAGDLTGAIAAYAAHRDALPNKARADRARANAKIADLEARARGTVEDEPASTHREQLDKARADRRATHEPRAPKTTPAPAEKPKERIVRKWYFWVAIAAIAASAAAVTAIAIKAANEDEPDSLGVQRDPGPLGPALLRF